MRAVRPWRNFLSRLLSGWQRFWSIQTLRYGDLETSIATNGASNIVIWRSVPVFGQIRRPIAHQIAWPLPVLGCRIVGIVQLAIGQRQATAADAAIKIVPQTLQRLDSGIQMIAKLRRQACPIGLCRRRGSRGLLDDAHFLDIRVRNLRICRHRPHH